MNITYTSKQNGASYQIANVHATPINTTTTDGVAAYVKYQRRFDLPATTTTTRIVNLNYDSQSPYNWDDANGNPLGLIPEMYGAWLYGEGYTLITAMPLNPIDLESYPFTYSITQMLPFTPTPGDTINDDVYTYNVVAVDTLIITVIPVLTLLPSLTYNLTVPATIWLPSAAAFDAYNNLLTTSKPTYVNLPSRIQPLMAEEIDWVAKRGFKATFKMWLFGDYNIPFRSTVIVSGVTYKVVDVINRQRLDELMQVFLEVNP